VSIKKIAIGGAAAAALGIAAMAGSGTAFATGNSPVNPGPSSTVQQSDQSAPDTATSAEQSSGETAPGSDGPGGHADAAGSNVDHQFEGNE
jgi:hypothetical protein